jgi:spermidine synthase
MQHRLILLPCLVFSGLAALVYQITWTRLLGFVFGATTEAIGTVLAVFFGGMALGNLIAARKLARVRRPLRVYALLELGIGVFAICSLPLLKALPGMYGLLGADHGPGLSMLIRVATSALLLLPPSIAMGATLPVVARGLIVEDATLGRSSGILYAANTAGAVLGAYLCGFWGIPVLGLTGAVLVASAVNVLVAAAAFLAGGSLRMDNLTPTRRSGSPPFGASAGAPGGRAALLFFFGVSGFVAIGYEIIWSKLFGIVMEGTLYGFAAVLSANLCGIALGSAAAAPFVDRIRDLPRAFGALHLATAASVMLGMLAVPDLPFALDRLAASVGGGDAVHLLFAIAAPLVLLPTALFGAAFPILIRIVTDRASGVGSSLGVATAINTAGSIAASLLVGLWSIPRLGTDATLYALLLLQLTVALLVLVRFQTSRGRARLAASGLAGVMVVLLAFSFNGVNVAGAVSGRQARTASLSEYREILAARTGALIYLAEGRNAIVSVEEGPSLRRVRTDGLSEGGLAYAPPYYSTEAILLAVLPYLIAERPERSLVVGLGGGNTVAGLLATGVGRIEVVELEERIVDAVGVLFEGRENPLEDPRVSVRVNDGRNELLRARHLGAGSYDIITSQPSHPWRSGAASLFTEEFFQLARESLTAGGVFASWVDGFRLDPESLLSVLTSFERAFPGGAVANGSAGDTRKSFLLLGARSPLTLSTERMAARIKEPALRDLLALFELQSVEDVLARFDAPVAAFADLAPDRANTDDNAFVETRIPRRLRWENLDYAEIEARLDPGAPVLPRLLGRPDVGAIARALLRSEDDARWSQRRKLERLLRAHGAEIDALSKGIWRAEAALRDPASEPAALSELRALAESHPERPEPLRTVGHHLAARRGDARGAEQAFAGAWARSGDPSDAYQAGAAIAGLDASEAARWFARIPERNRDRFPGLALHAAPRALASGRDADELRSAYRDLLDYRQDALGWSASGIDELLSELARAIGDPQRARIHAEQGRRARADRAQPALERARKALRRGETEEASAALAEAAELLPGNPEVEQMRARVAAARGDPLAARRALVSLRGSARSAREAIAAENRLRLELGLPLLPLRSERDLLHPQD